MKILFLDTFSPAIKNPTSYQHILYPLRKLIPVFLKIRGIIDTCNVTQRYRARKPTLGQRYGPGAPEVRLPDRACDEKWQDDPGIG